MNVRFLMASAVLLVGGFGPGDDGGDDKDRLQGGWAVTSAELDGKEIRAGEGRKLVVKGDGWTAPSGGKFQFKIDATKNPKQLDLTSDAIGEKSTWPGIYKIDGDTLTFCRPREPGGMRPTEFQGGPGVFLLVCKRAGKK